MYTHNLDPVLFEFGFLVIRWYSLAYIFGILIGNFVKLGEAFSLGITFSVKFVLRLGIILLGIRLSLWDVFKFGSISIPLIIICIVVVIIVVRFLITKLKCSKFIDFTLWSQHLILHTRQSLQTFLLEAGYSKITIQ